MVTEGFYRIVFGGAYSCGVGMIALKTGAIVGSDVQGSIYRGRYAELEDRSQVRIQLDVTVPPNRPLVTGARGHSERWTFTVDATLRADFANGMPTTIPTEVGAITITFDLLDAF